MDQGRLALAIVSRRLAPEPVDGVVAGGRDDPTAGVRWHAGARPALHGHDEGLLDRLLGEVDVAEKADQRGHRPAELGPENVLDT
jgi:hypothetical protein